MPEEPSRPADRRPAAPDRQPPRALGPLGWLIRYTRGLILDQHLRRVTMFYVIIAAMLMAFVGETFLSGWLRDNPWRFVIYYLACAWLTMVAALLAIYDILMLRLQARAITRRMRSDLLQDDDRPEDH